MILKKNGQDIRKEKIKGVCKNQNILNKKRGQSQEILTNKF